MEVLILFVCLIIATETSFLTFRRYKPVRSGKRKVYVDTSALIDGRILNIARTGFLEGDLIILRSVLKELQLLADGKDIEKRNRARAGLQTVLELERVINVNTEIIDDNIKYPKVDEELIKNAKANHGAILTLDYNLIKVANAEKIVTLNINDLALSIRNEFLPGERISLKIIEKGANRGQGVGYLPDGTMVIVNNASRKVSETVNVELLRFHETSSGKMFFAKIVKK